MQTLPWSALTWLNEPPSAVQGAAGLEVLTGEQTDFWRQTSYGFTHDSGHLLGAALSSPAAIEVTFRSDLSEQFDQAELMLRANPQLWLKARRTSRLWRARCAAHRPGRAARALRAGEGRPAGGEPARGAGLSARTHAAAHGLVAHPVGASSRARAMDERYD
jgi:hypothetical protein